ncbi:MAG: hypothetical protein ACREE6_01090 [Limisphaerales bacterium]
MRLITTNAKNWQKHAWEMAKKGINFEVVAVNSRHILFIQELCAAYKCKFRNIGNRLQLLFPAQGH